MGTQFGYEQLRYMLCGQLVNESDLIWSDSVNESFDIGFVFVPNLLLTPILK